MIGVFWCDSKCRWCSAWSCEREECEREEGNMDKTKNNLLEQIKEDICDNYCQYRDTADEEFLCDAIRDGGNCPLDRLDELIN